MDNNNNIIPSKRASCNLINIDNTNNFILFGGSDRDLNVYNDFWLGSITTINTNTNNNNSTKSNTITYKLQWKPIDIKLNNNDNKEKNNILTPRYGCAIAYKDSTLYIHGGQSNSNQIMYNDFIEVKLSNNNTNNNNNTYVITSIKNLNITPINIETTPLERNSHSFTQCKDKLYIYGGGSTTDLNNDLWSIDLSTISNSKWNKIYQESNIPANEMSGIAYYNNTIFIIGGRETSQISHTIYKLNLDTKEVKTAKMPISICSYCSTVINKYFIIYGGINGEIFLNDVIIYDLDLGQWFKSIIKPSFNKGAIASSMSHNDEFLLIFGGSTLEKDVNDYCIMKIEDLLHEKNLDRIQ